MKTVIESLLGQYVPLSAPDGTALVGIASIDFAWLVGALCFLICLIGCIALLRTVLVSFR